MKHWSSKSHLALHQLRKLYFDAERMEIKECYFSFFLAEEIFENISIYIKHGENWRRERGMEKVLMLFQCSNNCQNDVILCRVEIPFFFTSQLL